MFGLNHHDILCNSIEDVFDEIKKCSLLCCRCHRESHYGLLNNDEIVEEYRRKWIDITENGLIEKVLGRLAEEKEERRAKAKVFCIECGSGRSKGAKNSLCLKCFGITQRRVERPSKEELGSIIGKISWLAIGKKYGVSDNAARKWARTYGLALK